MTRAGGYLRNAMVEGSIPFRPTVLSAGGEHRPADERDGQHERSRAGTENVRVMQAAVTALTTS